MKIYTKIGLLAIGGYLLYKITNTNPKGLDITSRRDLPFFEQLIKDGYRVENGDYPFIIIYRDVVDDSGSPIETKTTQFAATDKAYREIAKRTMFYQPV